MAAVGEVGMLAAPVGTWVSSGPEGFGVFRIIFLAEGLGGLSTLGDSLSG
jgi:hypothetical protein